MKKEVKNTSVVGELLWMLQTRIRDYAMYIALAAIFILFGNGCGDVAEFQLMCYSNFPLLVRYLCCVCVGSLTQLCLTLVTP